MSKEPIKTCFDSKNDTKYYIGECVKSTNIIPCACLSSEHHIIYHKEIDDREVYLYPLLNKKPFLKRIWIGIKYIFGYQSRYGMYGELIINKSNIDRLEDIVNFIKKK